MNETIPKWIFFTAIIYGIYYALKYFLPEWVSDVFLISFLASLLIEISYLKRQPNVIKEWNDSKIE